MYNSLNGKVAIVTGGSMGISGGGVRRYAGESKKRMEERRGGEEGRNRWLPEH